MCPHYERLESIFGVKHSQAQFAIAEDGVITRLGPSTNEEDSDASIGTAHVHDEVEYGGDPSDNEISGESSKLSARLSPPTSRRESKQQNNFIDRVKESSDLKRQAMDLKMQKEKRKLLRTQLKMAQTQVMLTALGQSSNAQSSIHAPIVDSPSSTRSHNTSKPSKHLKATKSKSFDTIYEN